MKKLFKLLTLLLLVITPSILAACGNTYRDIEIVASSLGGGHSISMFVGETKELTFNVYKLPNNASGRLNFTKDSNIITQPQVLNYREQGHENKISFVAISYGKTELRVIAEGGKYISINIEVKEKITDFALKKDLVLVRGDASRSTINLNSDLFNFMPKETQQLELEFLNQNNEQISSVSLADYPTQSEIVVKVRSLHLEQTKEISIKIVDQIKPFNFFSSGQELVSKEQATPQNTQSTIYLSANKNQDFSFVKLQAVIEGVDNNLDASFALKQNGKVLATFDETKRENDGENTIFNFVLFVNGFDAGQEQVVFEAFYTNVDSGIYKVTRTFDVVVLEYPNKVFVNGTDIQNLEPIILHVGHFIEITKDVKIDIYPLNAKFDRVEVSYNTSNVDGQRNISDFIEFKQNNLPLTSLTNFNTPIVARGIEDTQDGIVWLNLNVFYGSEFEEEFVEEISIPFNVKAGASQLHIEDEWSEGIIYVSLNNGPIVFERGLYVNELAAYLGDVEIRALTAGSSQIARVEAVGVIPEANVKYLPIRIYPQAPGQARFNVILANGVSKQIRIVVVPELASFNLDYNKTDSSPVTVAKYDANANIQELSMQMQQQAGRNFIKTKFIFKTNIENYLANYPEYFKLEYEVSSLARYDDVLRILTAENLDANGLTGQELITFKLQLKKIDNFKLVETSNLPEEEKAGYEFVYSVKFNAFLPLTSMSFTNTQLSLFSESDLGIYYKNEASKETKLTFMPASVAQIVSNVVPNSNSHPNIKLEYYASNTESYYNANTKVLTIGSLNAEYGSYNVETGKFTLDYKATSIAPFDIIAKLTYFEKVYVARFTVTPKTYIMPNSIQFADFVQDIYLDATRPSAEINMYILPNNATHKVIEYDLETPAGFDSRALTIQIVNNTKLTVVYNAGFSATSGEATIVIKPRASVTSSSITPSNTRRIKVKIGNGDFDTPYRIYTAQQLLNINVMGLDKHYEVMNKIDLSHITNFASIGRFSGSIRGNNKNSEISGIKIVSTSGANAGLFTAIETKPSDQNSGLIKDLKVSGSLNITLSASSNVGLIAGVLEAGTRLENVSVTLSSSRVNVATQLPVNIGGIVGLNKGKISSIISSQSNEHTSAIVGAGEFVVNYLLQEYNPASRSFVGGVAGFNDEHAVIERVVLEDVKLFNLAGYFTNLNITIDGNYPDNLNFVVGLIAGKNLSVIQGQKLVDNTPQELDHENFTNYMKIGGKITIGTQANNIVGGIVGENTSSASDKVVVDGVVSRVKISSYGNGTNSAYLGGLFGINNGGEVKNLALQAIEDASSLGIEASMIYSDQFGTSVTTQNRVGVFGYVITKLGQEVGQIEYDPQNQANFAVTNNLQAQTFVGTEDDNNVPASRRKLVSKPTTATYNNYYGDFVVANNPGIKFAPASINFVVDEQNFENKLVSATSSIAMSYLKLHKAKDAANQNQIDFMGYNTYDFPFATNGEVVLVSLNTEILTVLNNGMLKLNRPGVAPIQVYSLLNKKVVRNVYIFVTYAFDDYNLYLNNTTLPEYSVIQNNNIQISGSSAISLLPVITASNLDIDGKNVELVATQDIVFESVDVPALPKVVFEKVGGTYILRAVNSPGITHISLNAKVFANFGGHAFAESQVQPLQIHFDANHYVGATKVSLGSGSLQIEPIEKTDMLVEILTDSFEDDIIISQFKHVGSVVQNADDSFLVKEKNRLYNISVSNSVAEFYQSQTQILQTKLTITQNSQSGTKVVELNIEINLETLTLAIVGNSYEANIWLDMYELFGVNQNTQYSYTFTAFANQGDGFEAVSVNSLFKLNKIQALVSVEYNLDMIDITNPSNEYAGNYSVVFASASNTQVSTELVVKINPQSIGIVSVASFEGSQDADILSGKQEYNFVDPMARNKNHFKISMFPLEADYDYIKIDAGINPNTQTQVNTIFTLINTDGTSRTGARNVVNGLIIDKNLISSDIFVRYSVEMLNLFNEDAIPFVLRVYKNNNVIYTVQKTIRVKFRQDVTISIEGKTETDGVVFVTRGSTYNFTLSSNGYKDSEVIINALTPNIVSASIASRTLAITTNPISYPEGNLKVDLQIFGRKIVNGEVVESSPQQISLVVVDYLILENTNYIPVQRATNKSASVSIGDTLTLQAEFVVGQTVEYQTSIASILNTIKAFEETITKQGTWQYQMGVLNSQGRYEFVEEENSSGWTTISGNVNLAQTDGYFTISVNKEGKFVFTPHKVLNIENAPYKLRFVYGYNYRNGVAVFDEQGKTSYNVFTVNVYQMSAIDSPTPIYTTAQLQAMNPGSYYILMNNITIGSNFVPISTQIGGLDGNNKKIIFNSNIAFDAAREFVGLFETIGENTLIRNLNIEISSSVVLTLSKASTNSVFFGVLAGQNNGMITNVSVKTLPNASLRVVFLEPQGSAINYAAGLVGYNSLTGSVTNSRVEISLYSASSLSGFVGYNRGKVANSYVNDSLIVNTSSRLENKTAGFVVINAGQDGQGGQIISSYVSGVSTNFAIYANSANRVIQSSREVGGFAYENSGVIKNSYSNIPISASSNSAGFVFTNYGVVENSYSTSLMKETSEGTYGFIKSNYGTLKNNYFLEDSGVNDTINDSNRYTEGSSSNVYKKAELLQLSVAGFANQNNFNSYAFAPTNSVTKGVWFFPLVRFESQFNNASKTFTIGRPELVGPNLIAISEQEIDFDRTIENTQTGEVNYAYRNVGDFYQGSIYNPIIISSASELEQKMTQTATGTINNNSFRIVGDIDYGQDTTSSNLYKLIFAGDIEGNGMEISNYIVNISANLGSAGLFSKIGIGSSQQGVVKNLVLKPGYINLPNTNAVGALAGTIESATLFNIEVNGQLTQTTSVMIIGKNLVGGVFGRATGSYTLHNISSNISVTANYRSSISLNPGNPLTDEKIGSYFLFRAHTAEILARLSYSGAVGGVLAGNGKASYVYAGGNIVSNSEWAALMFGGVGDGVLVENAFVTVNSNQIVQASAYGATIAAEFYGKMQNATVSLLAGSNSDRLFRTTTYKPYGIGGVVGLLGSTENLGTVANPTRRYTGNGGLYNVVSSIDVVSSNVEIVGGIVAQMLGGRLGNRTAVSGQPDIVEGVKFEGVVTSAMYAGGIVGKVSEKPDAPIEIASQTIYSASKVPNLTELSVSGRGVNPGMIRVENDNKDMAFAGGVVGKINFFGTSAGLGNVISNAKVNSQIRISAVTYGENFAGVYAGGIIGKVENLGFNATLNNASFESRIVISLRNLNFTSSTNPIDLSDNIVRYGFILGGVERAEGVENSINVTGTSLKYSIDTFVYRGEVSQSSNYLLFSYVQKGETKHYEQDKDLDPSKHMFKNNVVSGEQKA